MKIGIVGCGMPTLTQNDHVASLQRPAGGSLRVLRLPQMTWGSSEIAATVRKKEPTHQGGRTKTRLARVRWDSAKARHMLKWHPRVPLRDV